LAVYFDSSALAKLVVRETETAALEEWLDSVRVSPISSVIARVELERFARLHGQEELLRVSSLLEGIDLLAVSDAVIRRAGSVEPALLRTLDAIHLATALQLSGEETVVVTYDRRLGDACLLHGLDVVAPT
jgi:uncharacterized protein